MQAVLTQNLRKHGQSETKVLLLNVEGIERDHCWVTLTPELDKLLPRTNRYKLLIEFTGKLKEYTRYSTDTKQFTINKIKNVQIIKKLK